MIIPAPPDIAFSLFGLPIYWYGITMACAIFVSMVSGNILYNKVNFDFRKDVILEYAPIIIILGIVGARLYFCSLNGQYYFNHLLEILDLRQGGLSIHGAIIGGIAGMVVAARRVNVPLSNILDSMACATILGQSVGRWGNYFNSEAYGIPVLGQKWGLFIPEAKRVSEFSEFTLFHPTFLYESVLDFSAFVLLTVILLKFGRKYRGLTFFAYLTVYSVIRFFIERIRVDSALNVGSFPIAEIVSVALFFGGLLGIAIVLLKKSVK